MRIEMKLFGDLKKYAPGGLSQFSMTVPPATTLAQIDAMLAITGDDYISLVNGRRTHRKARLKEGDTIVLMPPIAGG